MSDSDSAHSFQPLLGSDPTSVAEYQLLGRLGSGAFGVVYAATTSKGKHFAIKVLRAELSEDQRFRRRLAREAEALRRVKGDRTVKIIDVVTETDQAYLVMELLEGSTLDDRVEAQGPLQAGLLWFAAQGLIEALRDIHAAGVIHRDLKPSNVMYGPDGIKVLDFGISVVAEETSLTQTGAFVGTAAWVSPEQVKGKEVTEATDVFNLGLVMAFAATGRHPFGEGRSDTLMYRISSEEPDLSDVPNPVKEALERCLAREPQERPSVEALAEFFNSTGATGLETGVSDTVIVSSKALDDAVGSSGGSGSDGGTRIVQPPSSQAAGGFGNRKVVAALVAAVIAVAAVAGVVLSQGSDDSTDLPPIAAAVPDGEDEGNGGDGGSPDPPSTSAPESGGPTSAPPAVTVPETNTTTTTTTTEVQFAPPTTANTTTTTTEPEVRLAPTTIAPPTTQPTAPKHLAILTGLEVSESNNQPALVVKIDNAAAAHPQSGLNQADIVFEELIEGNQTRFTAIFQSQEATQIGPIRSVRTGDFDLLRNLNQPLFANSGGNAYTMSVLQGINTVNVGLNQVASGTYSRAFDRYSPHNLMSSTQALRSAATGRGGVPPTLLDFRDDVSDPPFFGQSTSRLELNYGAITVGYSWNSTSDSWQRKQNGRLHLDSDGIQVAPQNLIIQFVDYGQSIAYPFTPEPLLLGQGEAWILSDGKLQRGSWNRSSSQEITRYFDLNGAAVQLNPGRTWISLTRTGTATAHP
jgi:serine/threonine protein kinase